MKQSILVIILAISVSLVILHFTADKTYKLKAFEVGLDLDLASYPRTTINFPPAGEITADTHITPINLNVTLEAIHQQRLAEIIAKAEDKEALYSLLQGRIKQILRLFVLRLLVIGSLAGGLGAALVKLEPKTLLTGIVAASLVIGILTFATYYSYDITAFEDPHFSGMLEAAPWMVGVIQEGLTNIEQLGAEMEQIASNMSQLFAKLDSFQTLGQVGGEVKVLHISDLHNNPAALQFVSQIVDSFAVDLVIDTGDITEYGTALEGELLNEIDKLAVPYLFVAGNHDSPAIIEKLKSFANVRVLASEIVSAAGLTIAGAEYPALADEQLAPANQEEMQEFSRKLAKLISESSLQVDIAAVHQYELGQSLIGKVPVLLHGHTHSFELNQQAGTVVINAGTTGAAGVRGFKNESVLPNSVALLHYGRQQEELELKIVDIIKFYSQRSGFTLQRKLVNGQGQGGNSSE